ncbi:hypothetical protein GCM10010285_31690 [Streptomyces pseudogriseolus]|uniref:Uncharacterized protein n=1 Tax=Streptomyces pseudogriseolus TaxID=36817 RepID=A0ABQ2T3N5_STREZ|nr:hypothetical protein GCM10010285_31690 [Streptomyces rubiginosus]
MTPPVAADAVVVDSATPPAAVRAPAASNAERRTATARLMVVAFRRSRSVAVMGMSLNDEVERGGSNPSAGVSRKRFLSVRRDSKGTPAN